MRFNRDGILSRGEPMPGDSTRAVHEAERFDENLGAISTPIYQTSTFGFVKAEDVSKAVKGQSSSFVYSRWSNPTVARLEAKLASLEGAQDAAFFSSGMAAISTAVLSFVKRGSHVVAIRDLYGESFRLIDEFLPSFGVESTLVDTTSPGAIEGAMRRNTKIVYIESPTNPALKLVDIRQAARIAHRWNALLLVDNTFASPVNQCPIMLGADLSLHSATKYLNGHADVIAGAVAGRRLDLDRIKHVRRILGGVLDPHAAWLVLRGIKTLSLRVKTQNQTGMKLASFLSKHPKVNKVNYPGLRAHPQYSLAARQMRGYGGMLSFEIKGKMAQAMKFTESVKVATLAASLGGVETLVVQPVSMTHLQLSSRQKAKVGMSDTLIRVSVGIEDALDIIDDFRQALSKV
jgi:cystathionine beta-lyase/cystathionine gamma-synthase